MLCPNCNTEIEDGRDICPNCGTHVSSSEELRIQEDQQSSYHYGIDGEGPNDAPYIEPVMSQRRFYEKTWFIILALILFWPVGVVLMWLYASWPKAVKIIVSVLCALALINMIW